MAGEKDDVMGSLRDPLVLKVLLRCQGREVACRVSAVKVTMPGDPRLFEYVDYKILDAHNLPDSDYELSVEGRKIPLRRKDGNFLSVT
jgi:hypothetical protein